MISDSDSDYDETTGKSVKKRKKPVIRDKSNVDVKSELEHEASELKERKSNYKCKDCGKTFLRSYNLRRHVVTHSKKRPFNCEYCEKGFNRIDLLRRHVVACYLNTDEGKQRYGRKISQQLLDELDQRVRKQAKPCNKSKKKAAIDPKPNRDVMASNSGCDDQNDKVEENDFDSVFNDTATYEDIDTDGGQDNIIYDSDDEASINMQQALCFVDVTMVSK